MRTRATGQSPGGFHVLASPKRVRRQPPPVRISRTPVKASESSSEDISETGNKSSSICDRGGSPTNGDASNRQSVPRPNTSQKKSISNGRKPSLSTSSRSVSANSNKNVPARNMKNTGVKRRTTSVKKTQLSCSQEKYISNSKLTESESRHAVALLSVHQSLSGQQSGRKSVNPQSIQSILGKRDRSASLKFSDTAISNNISSNPKRARLSIKDSTQIDLSIERIPQIPHLNRSERKYSDTGQNGIASPRDSQQGSHQPGKVEEEASISPSKTPLVSRMATTPSTVPIRKIGLSKVNPDNTEILETHLRRGMQSIMSRMNKYQYKPLPKNVQSIKHNENSLDEAQVNNLDITNTSINYHQLKDDEDDKSRQEIYQINGRQTQNSPSTEIKSVNPHVNDGNGQTPNKCQDIRHFESENLFRSSAPNATYQNILRDVAEWAMRDTSKLPKQDGIGTILEKPKEFEASEKLVPTEHDPVSPMTINSLSRNDKNICLKKHIADNVRSRNRARLESRDEHVISTRHVAFSALEEPQSSHSNVERANKILNEDAAVSSSRIEPLTPKVQQSLKPPISQGWSFLSTVKNMVTSPLKVLGFGFGDELNIQNVTKDIEFDYKPLATPTPSERRRVRVNGAATQRRIKRNTSVDYPARNLKIPQTDRPLRQRDLERSSPARRIFYEKRKDDSVQQEILDINKSSTRRRKKPSKRLEVSNVDTASNRNNKNIGKQIEEWPPKLDENRPVVDLINAAERLPRGPNGEDIATMLCKGWLISKHHDSFIREVGEPKAVTFSEKEVSIEPTSSSKRGLKQKLKTNTLSKENPPAEQIPSTPCGRSYGFSYEDDTSSDEEKTPCVTDPNSFSQKNSSLKEISRVDLSETDQGVSDSSKSKTTDLLPDKTKHPESFQALTRVVQRIPKSYGTPYTPRMPSNLRNVEALSPYLSQLTPTSSHSNALATADGSTMALIRVDIYESPLQRLRFDWSRLNKIDPKLLQFDQKVIFAVDDLPDYFFPSVELPIPEIHNKLKYV